MAKGNNFKFVGNNGSKREVVCIQKMHLKVRLHIKNNIARTMLDIPPKTPAWQRLEGKNPMWRIKASEGMQ